LNLEPQLELFAMFRRTAGALGWVLLACCLFVVCGARANAQPAAPASPSPSQLPAPTPSVKQAPTQAPLQAPAVCTQTIMVPQTTYKTMTVVDVVCKPVVRQREVTACRMVPQREMVTCRTTVMAPEQKTRAVSYTACRMTYEDVARTVTVMVPHKEVQQATRTVCKLVQTQVTKSVTRDAGGWGTKSFVDCCGCTHECQVWMPNLVTEQVACTVFKPQLFQEPCTVETMVCRPEQRQFTERVAKPVYETVTRNVSCMVAVPKVVEKQVARTTYRPVVEKKLVNVTEMVPTRVERQVTVPVCTMVAKVVACKGCCGW
jgi:hypothetical protein